MPETISPGESGHSEPLRFVYLHQTGTGMIGRLRAWHELLSNGGTRAVEGELIAMDGDTSVTAYATGCECDVLIYEPPGWAAPGAKP
jgi:hypothetical protein